MTRKGPHRIAAGRNLCALGRLLCALGLLLFTLPLAAGPAGAQGETFGPNLRVNHAGDGFYQEIPEIELGPAGEIYVVWEEWRHTTGAAYFARSLDGGASFEPEIRVDPVEAPGYGQPMLVQWPCLAVDGLGVIYVAWVAWEPGQTGRVFCARSIDGGISFENPILVSDSTLLDRAWPSVAGDPLGGVYVVWCDFRNGDDIIDLYFSRSDDGSLFSPNIKANHIPLGPNCTPPLPDIALGSTPGLIHIVWRHTTAGDARYVYACRSFDGGQTFEIPVEVSHDAWLFGG